ncbi:YihY family inner membrane protein [Azoarcus indigens]|uniref:UPF0761 membrane protein C7389_11953 n=1 Tax=Azoarcus indigens TaxID=29545 RepID=A0A4R6DRF8_9RHOO|nr:YihY family inner membrane protein [Azoarcus indigens]TDN47543.1 tRNA-processing RNAse BN [Azoarcus indigens]
MPLQPSREFVRLLAERFAAARCPQVAGSLAFTTLLALVPLIAVTLGVVGNLPGMDRVSESLRDFLLENLLPERAGKIITTYALQFSQKAARLTLIGTALLAITALMLLSTIEGVFNQIWGVRRPRALLLRITVYWFALTLGPVVLGGSVVATGYLASTSAELSSHLPWLGELAARLLPPLLLGALFSFLYFAVPNHPVKALHALAGGLAAALVFFLMQRAFGLFIARFPTYTLIYGTFAALPIFLVWLYLSWLVVLMGALVAASLPTFLERRLVAPAFPGDRAWAALQIMITLARAQQDGKAAAFDELRRHTGLPEHVAEELLGTLCEAGWAARSEEGHWLLTRSADDIGTAALIARFALDPLAWTAHANDASTRNIGQLLQTGLEGADRRLGELARTEPAGETAARTT